MDAGLRIEPGSRGLMDPLDLVPEEVLPALLDDPGFAALFRSLGRDPRNARGLDASARIALRSTRSFERHFRALAGTTWAAFVREWRLRSAEALLYSPLSTVGDVARRVGFRSLDGFSRAYRKRFGRAPRNRGRRGSP
jgi:transcriptional regulator GlxA family with amidase domain